jgi:pantetheine-phosphate adenylyltransferase
MRRAACPGTFDPVTYGHLDVIGRAARIFDEVVVAVGVNPSKRRLFDPEDRVAMLTEAVAPWENVVVEGFSGLLTDFCVAHDVVAVVKGLRVGGDFEYEVQMAQMNATLAPGVETVFLPTSPQHAFLSSSLVKEVAGLGGDVSGFVPASVHERLLAALRGDR